MSRALVIVLVLLLPGCDQVFGIRTVAVPDAPLFDEGCADHTREAFADIATFQRIAGCAGAWTIAGLRPIPPPQCERTAGNDGTNRLGEGCTASDLCAPGWGICGLRLDVFAHLPPQKTCADATSEPSVLFVAAQGTDFGTCNSAGENDVAGCGTWGYDASASCMPPFNHTSDNQCFTIRNQGQWECPNPDSELTTIRKLDPSKGGGVLCCSEL